MRTTGKKKGTPPFHAPSGLKVPDDSREIADSQQTKELGDTLDPSDPNFESELNYEGYTSIEEFDNDSYNSLDAEKNEDTPREVKIEDRELNPPSGEEDLIDPQGNRN